LVTLSGVDILLSFIVKDICIVIELVVFIIGGLLILVKDRVIKKVVFDFIRESVCLIVIIVVDFFCHLCDACRNIRVLEFFIVLVVVCQVKVA
jgi:hypothetical protein